MYFISMVTVEGSQMLSKRNSTAHTVFANYKVYRPFILRFADKKYLYTMKTLLGENMKPWKYIAIFYNRLFRRGFILLKKQYRKIENRKHTQYFYLFFTYFFDIRKCILKDIYMFLHEGKRKSSKCNIWILYTCKLEMFTVLILRL